MTKNALKTRKLFYLPLEPVAGRYTEQLSGRTGWAMTALLGASKAGTATETVYVYPESWSPETTQIIKGAVLDASRRAQFSYAQCALLVQMISKGAVKSGDIIYLQDFYTPGFDGVLYALDIYGIKCDIQAMIHAQTFDEFDFTATIPGMRSWMRPLEMGLLSRMRAVYVGSTVHRDMIVQAMAEDGSFHNRAPDIHVVSLPFSMRALIEAGMMDDATHNHRRKNVVYSSRLDKEKNPEFMLEVALKFLKGRPDYRWTICTGAKNPSSYNVPDIADKVNSACAASWDRIVIKRGLTKGAYYKILSTAAVQFNCASQDFVSWTALEASLAGCSLVYPNFRSFPEMFDSTDLYKHLDVDSAVHKLLERTIDPNPKSSYSRFGYLAEHAEYSRRIWASLVLGNTAGIQMEAGAYCNTWKHTLAISALRAARSGNHA